MAPNTTSPFALHSILEKDKLNGTNYSDWVRNLRIVLRADKKETVLDTTIPEEPDRYRRRRGPRRSASLPRHRPQRRRRRSGPH